MNFRHFILGSFLFLTAEQSSKARLGETLDQLVVRYGQGSTAGYPSATYPVAVKTFHQAGWNITVKLMDGVSVGEKFQKQGKPTDEEIATLLSINSQGQTWTEKQVSHTLMQAFLPVPSVSKAWQRNDGASATLTGPMPVCFELETKQLLDADQAQEDAAKKAKETSLHGF